MISRISGKLVRVEYRRSDKLAIALVSGGDKALLAHSGAAHRRNHRLDLAAVDAAAAEVKRQREKQRAEYGTRLQEMIRRGEELIRNADVAQVAKHVRGLGDPVIDLFSALGAPPAPELLMDDGLHLSLEGQKRIAREVVRGWSAL